MTAWAAWRLLKFTALVGMTAGLVGAATGGSRGERLRMLYVLGVPGFVLVWVAGWMLAKLTGRLIAEPWIVAGLLGSFTALHGAYLGAFARPERQRMVQVAAPTVLAGLLATVAWMVVRPEPFGQVALVGGVAGAVGIATGIFLGAPTPTTTPEDEEVVRAGFRLVAWLEGVSVILLMVVGMTFRAATGHRIDGETGLLGWTHGVLFLVYVQTLASTARALGWSRGTTALGFLASFVPGGTFVFEWRLGQREPAPTP